MAETEISSLLKAIHQAVSTPHQKDDDIALPLFDPEKNDCGAASWCESIKKLAEEFNWSTLKTAAKAGRSLRGSALTWFETWDPSEGRSWENLRTDISNAYPEKKNLSETLRKAVLYNSDSADSYSEYARHKIRLLRNTKIAFTEGQLIEIICGGIGEVNVRMASLNSGVADTASLITVLSTYVKTLKRYLDSNQSPIVSKRPKLNSIVKCFTCNQIGHIRNQCPQDVSAQITPRSLNQTSKFVDYRSKTCSYCKKVGHTEQVCFIKQRAETVSDVKKQIL